MGAGRRAARGIAVAIARAPACAAATSARFTSGDDMADTRAIELAWGRSADQTAAQPAHHGVVIVGAGPVGLVAALTLAAKGHRVVVIDRRRALSDGSRAICWSKRTLEIMHRLGLAQSLAGKGVTWQRGRVF